jgi:hypothetical protein
MQPLFKSVNLNQEFILQLYNWPAGQICLGILNLNINAKEILPPGSTQTSASSGGSGGSGGSSQPLNPSQLFKPLFRPQQLGNVNLNLALYDLSDKFSFRVATIKSWVLLASKTHLCLII